MLWTLFFGWYSIAMQAGRDGELDKGTMENWEDIYKRGGRETCSFMTVCKRP